MLDEQDFKRKADDALEDLNEVLLDVADEHGFEVDFNAGAMTIEFDDPPAKFVVSPNTPPRQIWVSALSKSYKLDWSGEAGTFVLSNTGQSLKALIAEVVSLQLGQSVSF